MKTQCHQSGPMCNIRCLLECEWEMTVWKKWKVRKKWQIVRALCRCGSWAVTNTGTDPRLHTVWKCIPFGDMSYFALTLMLVGTFFQFRKSHSGLWLPRFTWKKYLISGVKRFFIPIPVYFLIFISYCSGLRFWFSLVTWAMTRLFKSHLEFHWLLSCRFLF